MTPDISERSFEEAIEAALLGHGSSDSLMREAPASYGVAYPGGYHRRRPEDYDRTLCLIPRDVLDFIVATQPKEWARLKQHYGSAVEEKFLKRLASEIERRGTLDVLRHGIKDMGSKFRLAYFRPASGLNEETRRLYEANIFSVVRQLRYSTRNEKASISCSSSTASRSSPPSSRTPSPARRWRTRCGSTGRTAIRASRSFPTAAALPTSLWIPSWST
nr:hypothetical protein [Calditerricola satsumensis]